MTVSDETLDRMLNADPTVKWTGRTGLLTIAAMEIKRLRAAIDAASEALSDNDVAGAEAILKHNGT